MYIKVTLAENNKTYEHLEYFPKFNEGSSLKYLRRVYGERLISLEVIGKQLH